MRMDKTQGSITVFLSFLLPLLLAFVGTLLETARWQSVQALLPEVTKQSMEMMFADYNLELWQDYGLFAYTETEEEALEEITKAVEAQLHPKREDDKAVAKGLDVWQIDLLDLSMEEKESLADEEGELLKYEAAELMKYKMTEETLENILTLLRAVKETGASACAAEKKVEAEEQIYDYSKEMLEFIECIDGIVFGEQGVEYEGEALKTKASFVKQFSYGAAQKSAVGIRDAQVWESLHGKFYDVKEKLELLGNIVKEWKAELVQEEKRIKKIEQLLAEKEALEKFLAQAAEKQENAQAEEYKKQIADSKERKEKIKEEVERLQRQGTNLEQKKQKWMRSWEKETKAISKKAGKIQSCAKQAKAQIPKLRQYQKKAAEAVEMYKRTLEQKKEDISSEMYESFSGDCEEMAASVGATQAYDLNVFDTYLAENITILQRIKEGVLLEITEDDVSALESKEEALSALMEQAAEYHCKEFVFSYELIERKEQQKNPADTLKKLAQTSLLSLVVKDMNTLSKNDILEKETVFPTTDEKAFLETIGENVCDISMRKQGIFSSIFGELSSASEQLEASKSLKQAGQTLLLELLLNGYVQEMFMEYVSEQKQEQIQVLFYEQEYILSGKQSDEDNLSSVIKKIAGVRTVCNFLTLLTDTKRQKEAYTAAISIAGITGIEPLAQVLKNVILLVWAYEEALIDTAALMQGKTIPVMKTPSQISLSFQELFSFGRTLIQTKAEHCEDANNGCTYSEYLYLFLCMQSQKTVIYRMADLIQCTMQKRYGEEFFMKEAVFGCKMKANYHVPLVFFRLPFTSWIMEGQTGGWTMEVVTEAAY